MDYIHINGQLHSESFLRNSLPVSLFFFCSIAAKSFEPRHDKTNKMAVRPAKTQISPGHPPSLIKVFAVRMSSATHWAHCEDSDQNGRMPRLIWVFAGRTLILLVLSCRGSFLVESFPLIFLDSCSLFRCPRQTRPLHFKTCTRPEDNADWEVAPPSHDPRFWQSLDRDYRPTGLFWPNVL